MLIDGGVPTSAQYMSNTFPIPAHKTDIAISTSMAAEMMGLRLIFMDAGSGANRPVSAEMIAAVRSVVNVPLIWWWDSYTRKVQENSQQVPM